MTPDTMDRPAPAQAPARQRIEFRNGDEAAALVASAVGFDAAAAHAPEPIAFLCGAALGGARVVAAVPSHALAAAAEALAAQSSARVPLVLHVACRALASLPGAGCDHAVLYQALDAGWVVLCARDPQAVYDLGLAAVRIGEHADVRLPVLVAYDGHLTSDEKRGIQVVDDPDAVAAFLGARPGAPGPLDLAHPATYGAPLEDEACVANRAHVSAAMDCARRVIPETLAALAALTGRAYPVVEAHAMDGAEAAMLLLNSAAGAAREAVEVWRDQGRKVGLVSPNVLRPFPAAELRELLRGVAAVTVGDRAAAGGAGAGRLALEVRAAIQQDERIRTRVLSRVFGLAGAPFHAADAERLLDEALAASSPGEAREPFAYHGMPDTTSAAATRAGLPPLRAEETSRGMATVRRDASTGRLQVELAPLWRMTGMPGRIAPGHGACPGCGAFTTLHQLGKVLEGDVVFLFQSGCAIAVTTGPGASAHRVNCVHDATGHGAATLCGLVEAWRLRARRGELPAGRDPTFVMVTGDGGLEAGLGDVIAAAQRNPRMMILEYDNQGRMSVDGEPTRSAPPGPRTADPARLMAACDLPYVFTASEGFAEDLMRKAAKAQWYARHEGLAYGRILSFCPLHWKAPDDSAQAALQAALDSCAFPLYEVERGHTTITYDPDAVGRRKPVTDWLRALGRSAALADDAAAAGPIQAETDRRWAGLKALHDNPLL